MKINTLLLKVTPVLFGLSICILGFQHIYYRVLNPALFPVPVTSSGHIFLAYTTGIILMLCGIIAIIKKWRAPAFLIIGIVFLLSFLIIHLPLLLANLKNPLEWTGSFETFAIMSGAFLFAVNSESSFSTSSHKIYGLMEKISKFMFALSLIIFGIQHFQYADYIATLIPGWIPLHLFWAYFVGAAFFAAAISLAINIKQKLAMALLGIMFLFWVIFVHAPRVYNHINDRDEWSSLLICLLMACIAFLIMASHKDHFHVASYTP
jgi:uncharacterized membrane protein